MTWMAWLAKKPAIESLHHRLARRRPAAEAFIQVDEVRETELFKNGEGSCAASASLAMDEGGLRFVEFGELGFEVLRHDVDVLRALDMTVFEFVRRAHINDGHFAVCNDLGGFVGFDVFGGVCSEHEGRE